MASETPSFSIVVPCYRSERSLPELAEKIRQVFSSFQHDYEIILVNDGSPDNTWQVIEKLALEHKQVVGVNLSRNFGQQAAVLCGFELAQKSHVITLDDDLQHDPADIPTLFNHLVENGLDVVIARLREKKHGLIRGLGTRLVQFISMQVLDIPKGFKFSSYRVLKTAVAKHALKFTVANPVVGFLIFKATSNVGNCMVDHAERKYGDSNYSFTHLVNYCMTMMLDYSVIPLKLVGLLGSVISVLSFVLGFFYFTTWLLGGVTVSGFITIVLLMFFFFGLLFMSMGIIGAYLIRILQNSNVHPTYLVEKVVRT